MKCLLVDDEPLALDLVEHFLGRLDIRDVVRCENGEEASKLLQRESFDLLFLDIEMPLLGGLDLLKSLSHRPPIVITTAYRDYAVEGFEWGVLDYLVKPFSFPRFVQAMEKVRPRDPFLFLRTDRQLVRVRLQDILYIESRRDYVWVRALGGEWLCHQTLTDITTKLPPENFFRIHRSYTVALDKIEVHKDNQVYIQGKPLPVSREHRQALLQRLTARRP